MSTESIFWVRQERWGSWEEPCLSCSYQKGLDLISTYVLFPTSSLSTITHRYFTLPPALEVQLLHHELSLSHSPCLDAHCHQLCLATFIIRPFSAIQLDMLSKSPSKADPTAPGFLFERHMYIVMSSAYRLITTSGKEMNSKRPKDRFL